MIRILQFGMSNNRGGIETFLFNYYKYMDHTKIQFDFIKKPEQTLPFEDEILNMGGHIYEFNPCGIKKGYLKNKKQWMQLFDRVKPDIIHYNTIALLNLSAIKYAKLSGVRKRIVHAHSNTFLGRMTLKDIIFRIINKYWVKKYATDLWACSKIAGRWMFYDKFKVVPNAIDTERFRFDEDKRKTIRNEMKIDNKVVICNVGKLSDVKNQTFILDIALELEKRGIDISVLLLGEGGERSELFRKAEKLGINKDIHFMGNRENVEDYLSASDLFLFPSKTEGFGIVLLEAQANGLKCFASDGVIPYDTNVTDTVTFIPLEKSATYWADEIEKEIPCVRLLDKQVEKVKEYYDIRICAAELQKLYLEGIK